MAKVDKWTMAKKALMSGAKYAAVAVAALATVPVPEGVGTNQQATVVFGIAVLGAISKAIHNYVKTSAKRVPYTSSSGYGLLLVALALPLVGCVTTTAPDGTQTTSVDTGALSAAWDRYERLQARRDALEAEREHAPVARRVEIDSELVGLAPEVEALATRLGLAVP